jgi:hypothetical protein
VQPELRRMPVKDLVPADYNPRKITPARRLALKEKYARWGHLGVIVVNLRSPGRGWPADAKPTIVSGHQGAQALADLGVKDADVKLVDVDEAEERAMNQALNEHDGYWHHQLRADGIRLIDSRRPELLPLTGLSPARISTILHAPRENSGKPTPKPGRARSGDVWTLGSHVLEVGEDAAQADALLSKWEAMTGKKALLDNGRVEDRQ